MRYLALMLVASSALLACQKDATPGSAGLVLGQPFELRIQQPVTLPAGSGGPLTLTFTDVQDARCPVGSQCIWAGYAAVVVQLTDATAPPQTARLTILNNLPTYTRDSVRVTLNQRPYWLRLLDVTPHPGEGGSQPPVARLRLRPA